MLLSVLSVGLFFIPVKFTVVILSLCDKYQEICILVNYLLVNIMLYS